MFYNCGGERQTFACRLLTPINAGLPPSSEGMPLSCEGPPPSSVLCCRLFAWYGAELERDGIREASLRYGTADRRYGTADQRYGTADRRYVMADPR